MDEERPQFLPPRGVSRQLWEESPDGTSVPVWAPKRQFPHWRLGNFLLRKNPGIAPREALKMAYLVYAIFQRLNPSVYGWVQSLIEENGWEGTSRFLRKIFLALHQAGGGEKYFISGPHWVGGDNSVVVDFKVDCDQEEITWEVEFLPAYDEEAGKVTYLPGETYDWGEIPVVGKKGEEEEEADRILSLLIRRLDRWMS
ncbi:MAG: hypothetical protein N2999_08085, partial [Proteobacteria bacterium]|nr:hypothetical protein [Pseudomonadota bacterium]